MDNDFFLEEMYLLQTTERDYQNAKKLAYLLLNKKITACISFNQIKSSYWWEGDIETTHEFQLIIKTLGKNLQELIDIIKQNHSYEIPELIYWRVTADKSYMSWLKEV